MSSSIDPARRAALVGSSLRALVTATGATPVGEPAGIGTGAALMSDDGTAWVLLVDRPASSLGGALGWAVRQSATRLHVLASEGTDVLARRAASFMLPIAVSHLAGRTLVPAVAQPLTPSEPLPQRHRELVPLIVAGGAEPVEEHGVLVGEVAGLEVCRVVDDAQTGEVRLEVGIGAHDRETFQMLHGDRPTVEALADVVRSVGAHRSVGALQHPLNQLAASRLLRARIMASPSLVGAGALVGAEPPAARSNLKDEVPCVAREVDGDRIVVCTTGVDLDAVPWAADAIAVHGASECLIAAPARDVLDIQQRLAALLVTPTRFVPIDPLVGAR
jgi:hypothetical protein